METKYTKGRWVIESTKMAGTDIVVQTVIKTDLPQLGIKSPIVCDMYGYMTEEGKANAKLIAASPRMYEYIYRKAQNGDEDAKLIIATIE